MTRRIPAEEAHTRQEVELAIETVTDGEFAALLKVATYWASGTDFSPEELLQEAFLSALDEDGRRWRLSEEFLTFVKLAMKSIARNDQKKKRIKPLLESQLKRPNQEGITRSPLDLIPAPGLVDGTGVSRHPNGSAQRHPNGSGQ